MGTGLARTIDLEVYLNYDDEGGAPVSGDSTEMHCAQDAACVEATECGEGSAEVKVLTFDSYGDGWSDPFGEATEFWTLTGATGSWSGNLMKGHAAARSTLCLADGDYDFSAPGAVSWHVRRLVRRLFGIGGDEYPDITVVALGSAMATAACVMTCCCRMKKANRRPGTGGKGSTKSLATEPSRSPDSRYDTGQGLITGEVVSEVSAPMPKRSRGAEGAALIAAAGKSKKFLDPRDYIPDPDFDVFESMSSSSMGDESISGMLQESNPMFRGRARRGSATGTQLGAPPLEGDEDVELGLNGVPEEGQQEAEGGEEERPFRATEQSNPLFNADRASGPLEKPTRGDKAGGEGQGRVEVEVVSRAIPQRFRSATRGIRLHDRDVRSQQEEAPAAGRRTDDDRAARERQDSGHRRRGSRRGSSGDGRATRKRSKSRGRGDSETPSRRRAPIQRVRSFGSDSSFKSMAKNLAESTSFRHSRERYQVAPKNRPSRSGGDTHERKSRKRSSTSRADQGRGATTSSSGAPRPRRGESSTAPRGERRDRDKSRGRGVDGTAAAFASEPSRSSRRGTASRGGGGAGGPAKSRRAEDGERSYSPGSNFSDGSIVVPTVRACASVGRPSARLSDMLAGNVVSNSSMRRGSSGNRQADVQVLDLRRHSTGGRRSREPVGARAGSSGGGVGGGGGGAATMTTANDDAEAPGGGRDERRRSRDSGGGGGSRSSGRSSGGGVRAEDYGAPRSKAKGNRERSGSADSSGGGGDRGSTGKGRRQQEDGATTNPGTAGSPREKAHPFVVGMGGPPGGSDDDGKGGNNGGSLSFSNNGDDSDLGDGGGGGGRLTRGRTKYRQSRSSRARERAYQETRSRSRGSSISMTSLQRVVEVSEESLSSVSPDQMNPALAGRYSRIASRAAAGAGRRRHDDGSHDDEDEEDTDRRMFPPPSAAGSDVDFHSMMDGTVASGESSFRPDSCSRSVPPSSALRFHVSEIKMPGNAAAVAADKRRRRESSDSDSYSSHGASVRHTAESPAPRAYGSRRARPDNTRSDDGSSSKKHASSSSRAAAAAALERTTTMSSAGRSSRRGAGGGAGWRQQARLRRAMVLAVQQKAQEDEQKGGSGDPLGTRRSTGSQYLDGGRGRGGEKTRGRLASEDQDEAAGGHVLRRGGENRDLPPVPTGALRDAPGRSARGHVLVTKRAAPGEKHEHQEDERASGGGGSHRTNFSAFSSLDSTATSVADDDDDDVARSPFQSRGESSSEAPPPPPPPEATAPRGRPRSESKAKLELRREREQETGGQATGHSSSRNAWSSNSSTSETRRHSGSGNRRRHRRRSISSSRGSGGEGASDASSERQHRRDRKGKPRSPYSLDGRRR
ncbi:hypothetical protein Esi_0123_0079 [Ectocarpus siliculosus]|uniref:Uncharacterized protein n=1 Tax=Ectocarpus siliculosus TaxID=2880 RepID=D7FIU0_ECTSI|nr:hypothetical protein Esi_0123_0079 [Ectocarpus siliculosus]|eukprot:CBJ28907.1 hypothetical protein Esi_0123_0079 [Ectocarpus siliculosus]